MTGPSLAWWALLCSAVAVAGANSLPALECEVARMKCAYRPGCAQALHSYMVGCADVLAGRTARCPWACKKALIKLTSTEAGLALSACECGDNEFCQRSKERAEVCRPEVSYATADDTVVSCSVAEWICAADPLCATALDFYHRLCRPLFHGRKCSLRCNNSLHILDRQEKAGKLRDCYCDGTEDFPCVSIKMNTQRLCYGKEEWDTEHRFLPPTTTEAPAESGASRPGLACYLLCALVVLWTFRTSVESLSTNSRNGRFWRQTLVLEPADVSWWPWWWTSESYQS